MNRETISTGTIQISTNVHLFEIKMWPPVSVNTHVPIYSELYHIKSGVDLKTQKYLLR